MRLPWAHCIAILLSTHQPTPLSQFHQFWRIDLHEVLEYLPILDIIFSLPKRKSNQDNTSCHGATADASGFRLTIKACVFFAPWDSAPRPTYFRSLANRLCTLIAGDHDFEISKIQCYSITTSLCASSSPYLADRPPVLYHIS